MKKILLNFLWVLMLLGSQAYAQSQTVTGRITGKDDGQPLAGVSVTIKGARTGTQTNADGKYSITVPSGNATIVFSFIGFITSEQVAKPVINLVLIPAQNQLNEVVVVPYGTAKRETFVGSAASISAKDLQNRQVANPLNALAGAAPGIQVNTSSGQPGASPTIRIRGFGSVNASNDPLIIVDGVQYEGSISNINSEDIENMSVLKDASSTSLYGAKAANGVIIITTKKGKKGIGQLSVKATTGVSRRGVPEYDRVNAYQYYPLEWQAYRNSIFYAANSGLNLEQASMLASGLGTRNTNNLQVLNGKTYLDISQTLGSLVSGGVYKQSNNPFNVSGTQIVDVNGNINPNAQLRYNDLDWYKPLERTAARQDYSLSYSGATDKTDYYASLGYTNEKGYLLKTDFSRLNARLNINTQATKWFRTGLNFTGTSTQSNQSPATDGGTSYVNPIFFARNIGPIYNVYAHDPATGASLYNADGSPVYDLGGLTALGVPSRASGASPGRHILQETLLNDNLFKRNLFSVRTYGEVSFLKHFKFTTNLSADYSSNYGSSFDNPIVGDGAPAGRSTRTTTLTTTYNLNQILNYSQTFNKHNFDVLVGHENYSRLYDVLSGSRNTLVVGGNTELVNYTTTSNLTSYKDRDRSEGYFSRVNYDYDQKYLFSASIRRDATSRFAENVRWGTFGSVGLGWRVDREDFLKSYTWIDLLKLRTSYGTVGNYQTLYSNGSQAYYLYQALYDINNNAYESGFSQQTTAGNPNLQWEVNKQLDLAVEFGFFKNRITGSVEYYDRRSSNLLFSVPLPVSNGVTAQWQNVGTMYNRGFEVNLGGDPVRTKNFTWSINLNASTLKNRITKMPDAQKEIVSGTRKLSEGHSIYDFYTRSFSGVDPSDGSSLYIPNDGLTGSTVRTVNGVSYTTSASNAKLMYVGESSVPKVFGSLSNSFRYKNFDFSFLVNYSLGGKIYDSNYASLMSVSSYGSALHVDALKSWQKAGDVTEFPRLDQGNAANLYAASSRWLTNASYLYFRNASMSYNLPNKLLSKISVKNARVFVSGENLYLISARKGFDPSQAYTTNTAVIGSVTNAFVPSRILSLGLNVTL
ncbi:TonB-dependent receptor [Mucilaginibacter sp. Bleaf8]|uniref:SusC/RagA family TonB-linked outer membrane protein n=1 Tax=Mucilaginibacter sp. Bleaf8 TaxID=2834430 RepID=UPI001BD1714B|nr:TonB-dependent receptor [Mucilaginibacter sp. Bleaf8]MBS7564448.1 TonB-dependent receptor [Mucilaginibacter sp. Bleaf8]